MSLKRLLLGTLNGERFAIIAMLINTAVLIVVFNLMMKELSVIYPLSIEFFVLFWYLVYKGFRLYSYSEKIADATADGSGNFSAIDNASDCFDEQLALHAIAELHRSYNDRINELSDRLNSRNDMFSQFVHNMKSSVSVISLACEKQSRDSLADITHENEKLKQNLEQTLNVLRIDDFTNDYIPAQVDLSKLLRECVNDKKRDFIYSEVYPKFSGGESFVYTDSKWCKYIISQLISNAVKYSSAGKSVYFEITQAEGRTVLSIKDEGIGISQEDLPRVFDLFFTGSNGRQNSESTGIGLAMVQHVCKKLSHEISVESEKDKGTTVKIIF